MSNLFNQYQQDVMGTANTMMTQLLCAEKGIDFNQVVQAAQQQHAQSILMAEQQRQMNNLIKRHYQNNSGSIISKIKDVIAPDNNMSMFMPMPMQQPMFNPMQPQQQQLGFTPQQASSYMNQPQPQHQPVVEIPLEDNRVATLEKDMASMKEMLTQLTAALNK
ncbi:hypothetical protein ABWK22_02815 [Gottfriedia acidiceleris]|uniref:hypothetical protein n=1 Tax=Gottfriedia acidiceleris TaxID=371036 RepID=UPI003398463C